MDIRKIPSPCYVMEERLLRRNLELIQRVANDAGVTIIPSLKAFALWKTFPILREYIPFAAASSLYEARLAYEEMGSPALTCAPVYSNRDFPDILTYSSRITFNSIAQFERFFPAVTAHPNKVSCGLRINPEYSPVRTAVYNPCLAGSRMGITADTLNNNLPEGIEGLHFHTLCESSSYDLERTLQEVEKHFQPLLTRIRWLNMGGGHLITDKAYDTAHLIRLLRNFKDRYPTLDIVLEPGSAFVWQTGFLLTTVEDIVCNNGILTAIIDASFACHMPDCLEMPYKPRIRHASDPIDGKPTYRIGGNSCLSGDFIGDWSFDKPLQVGDKLIFEDMLHYTTVKTTMFNGVQHPSIALLQSNNRLALYKTPAYDDYKQRMD